MWRYLKAAFSFRPALPGIGRFPVNPLAVAGFLILGFGHPAFWLLGLGLETAYLLMMATHPRFQRLVELEDRQSATEDDEARRRALMDALGPEARARLRKVEDQCDRLADLGAAAESALIASNRQAVRRIVWLFVKLLVAQQHLQSEDAQGDAAALEAERRQIQQDLAGPGLSRSLQRSKEATLRILAQRIANVERRARALAEIASDLKRIEEQVKLGLEEARLKGDQVSLSFDVDLESELLEDSYGAAGPEVVALDRAYAAGSPARTPDGPRRR